MSTSVSVESRRPAAGRAQGTDVRPWIVTILVNWRGSGDTIECLESLFASEYPHNCVVVVDNGSGDGSLRRLAAWAEGRGGAGDDSGLGGVRHRCQKGVPFVMLSADEATQGIGWEAGARLVLVDAARNRGFAGGVNIGLRFALANRAVQYVWVLNNDTVVAPDCLSRMERRMASSAAGMCGCRIQFYGQPDVVQALGGARFRWWSGTTHLIGNRRTASDLLDTQEVERSLDHLSGASMLVARRFVEEIGLMDEDYFLYYEEMDWAVRARGRYRLAYADDAVVYHKEGASTGSGHQGGRGSAVASFFMVRSRLRFTRRFYPWALPSVVAYSGLVALRALVRGRREQASAIWSAIRGVGPAEALGWTAD